MARWYWIDLLQSINIIKFKDGSWTTHMVQVTYICENSSARFIHSRFLNLAEKKRWMTTRHLIPNMKKKKWYPYLLPWHFTFEPFRCIIGKGKGFSISFMTIEAKLCARIVYNTTPKYRTNTRTRFNHTCRHLSLS